MLTIDIICEVSDETGNPRTELSLDGIECHGSMQPQ
jgi:hypothetical protein